MAESIETHEPKVGDRYGALTGAMLEWQVTGVAAMVVLAVEEMSWREHALRQSFADPGRRGRHPRPIYLTRKQLRNSKRWELIEAAED